MYKCKKGFTLIELIIVVAVIAILAAAAVPVYLGLHERAEQGVAIGYASNLATIINLYNSDPANAKISSISSWSKQNHVDAALGNLTVIFSNEGYIDDTVGRITIDPDSYIATVNTTIS